MLADFLNSRAFKWYEERSTENYLCGEILYRSLNPAKKRRRSFNVPGTFPFHPPILSDSLIPTVIFNLSNDLYSSTLFALSHKQTPISRVFRFEPF